MFSQAAAFNQPLNSWNVSSVTDMGEMFANAISFNQNIGSWTTPSATDMAGMFNGATSFDQNIGSWDITSVTNMVTMFTSVTLSTANYDALLIGWEGQAVSNNVTFSGGSSKYSAGAAATARQALIDDHTWTITDGGQV
jgi:surface protein